MSNPQTVVTGAVIDVRASFLPPPSPASGSLQSPSQHPLLSPPCVVLLVLLVLQSPSKQLPAVSPCVLLLVLQSPSKQPPAASPCVLLLVLDPPLHEFLPHDGRAPEDLCVKLAQKMEVSKATVQSRLAGLAAVQMCRFAHEPVRFYEG
jgi:hypothetical protein